MSGLEDQLLGLVVREERPDLEEQRSALILSAARDSAQLEELEEKILRMLAESSGATMLDDQTLVDTLADAKKTSNVIGVRMDEKEVTKKEVEVTMAEYLSASQRGSILYFVLADLVKIDLMYDFSLSYFIKIFLAAVRAAPHGETLTQRLDHIIDHATISIVHNINRSLFEQHKVAFSFLVTTAVLRASGQIDRQEWLLLLHGVGATPTQSVAAPDPPEALPLEPAQWALACHLDAEVPAFKGLRNHTLAHATGWQKWMRESQPWMHETPGNWAGALTPIGGLLLVKVSHVTRLFAERRCVPSPAPHDLGIHHLGLHHLDCVRVVSQVFRPELLVGAMDHMSARTLGPKIIERPPLQLSQAQCLCRVTSA